MTYNLTPLINLTTPEGLITATDTITGNTFGLLTMAAVYIFYIKFNIGTNDRQIAKHITISSFINSVVAALLWGIGLLAWQWAIIPLVFTVVGFIGIQFDL